MGRAAKLWLFFAALAAAPALAQSQGLVVRDDTLGSGRGAVVGPGTDPLGQPATYLITPEMGEQQGDNLFHSFERFDIGTGETATFTGPDPIDGPQSVSNVISRVTGGDASEIDGTLRSTIPGADLWLLNPSGVMFGEGATLDVPGSFHASTGDYVGFEGGLERFYADGRPSSVLSTASPEAFGFLGGHEAAAISVTDATLETKRAGDGLELVGGDLTLTGATLDAPGGEIAIRGGRIVVEDGSKVLAENAGNDSAGTIDVAAGESVLVDNSLLSVSTHGAGNSGTIHLESPVVTLQNGRGLVMVGEDGRPRVNRPHEIELGGRAETTGSGRAGVIDIEAGSVEVLHGAGLSAQTVDPAESGAATGAGGTIRVKGADSVRVADRGFVTVESWGSNGDAGTIEIRDVGVLTVDGDWLTTLTASSLLGDSRFRLGTPRGRRALGSAGAITISAESVDVRSGGVIQSHCYDCAASGNRGSIEITAGDLTLDGLGTLSAETAPGENVRRRFGIGSIIGAFAFGGEADGGDVSIDLTGTLRILRGAGLGVLVADGASGNAGTVSIGADEILIAREDGRRGTGIFALSGTIGVPQSPSSGGGGAIELEAHSLTLGSELNQDFGSFITAAPVWGGRGGDITLSVGSLLVRGDGVIQTTTWGAGDGGDICVNADRIRIENGGSVSATSDNFLEQFLGPLELGDAGSVTLVARNEIEVVGSSELRDSDVSSASEGSGDAGNVTLRAPRILLRDGGNVATNAAAADGGNVTIEAKHLVHLDAGEITASVNGGPNTTGGNIRIDPEVVILQNDSHIVAKAVGGSGGQITIIADNYFAFPHSEVSAEAGNPDLSGTVEVSAPDVNLAGQLTTLPSSYLDAASLMREACAARRSGERAGSFAVRGNDGIPAEPDGWLPATVALEPAFGPTAGSAKPTAASGPVLASGSCR